MKSMMLLYAKTILHNLPLVNWHYWVQILLYHRSFRISLVIFQLVSFTSKNYVSHRLPMEKRNTMKMTCMKQFLHTYLECMHDQENIFGNLVKSALNISWLPLWGHFFPILSNIIKIFHWLILGVVLEAGQW